MSSASCQPRSSETALEQKRTLHWLESTKIIASESSCISRSAQRFRLVNSNVDGTRAVALGGVGLGFGIVVTLDDDEADSWVLNNDACLCIGGPFAGCELSVSYVFSSPVKRRGCWG